MAGVAGVGAPSLSEIQAWDVVHLENAATDWTNTAQHWEASFSSIHRASVSPGGTVWEGVAAEAAQERAFADLVKVRGLADELHESAAIARRGAETLRSAKQSVLDAVRNASASGYVVGEDLSVTPSRGGAAAQAQAQVYAARIQERAIQLAAHDQEIAAKITAATSPLHSVTFAESPINPPRDVIQPADYNTPRPLDPAPRPPVPAPGLPPDGVHPPVGGNLSVGPASRPSDASQGGRSLWDDKGGEWRYFPGDKYHNPHWDYNAHDRKFSPWDNVQIGDLPPHTPEAAPKGGAPTPAPSTPSPPSTCDTASTQAGHARAEGG
jgi:hypothetical protein